jgi:hypothetical protein
MIGTKIFAKDKDSEHHSMRKVWRDQGIMSRFKDGDDKGKTNIESPTSRRKLRVESSEKLRADEGKGRGYM